jgi:hypothetical protein
MMAERYPRLRLRGIPESRVLREGRPFHPRRQLLAREVFRIVFYLPHDHPDIASGVSQALARYIQAVGEGPKSIHDVSVSHDEGGLLTPERWELVRHLLQDTRRWSYPEDYEAWEQREIEKRRFERGLLFTGGFGIRNGYEFEYKARIPWRSAAENTSASILMATLPLDYLEEHGPDRLRQLALDMASSLSFSTGHAGLALRLYGALPSTAAAFRTELLRYPGIDLREAWGFPERVGSQVDGVHWLNFLGPPVLSRVEGSKVLLSRPLVDGAVVVQFDAERAMVSLGERPETGPAVTGKSFLAYHQLARVLEPLLEPLPSGRHGEPRHTSLFLTESEVYRWWRRFLD